jgi:hypothetical protein
MMVSEKSSAVGIVICTSSGEVRYTFILSLSNNIRCDDLGSLSVFAGV